MIEQYITYIINMQNNNTVELNKTYTHEEDAIESLIEIGENIIRRDGGDRHKKKCIIEEKEALNKTEYENGLYMKSYGKFIEIYEKMCKQDTYENTIEELCIWSYKFTQQLSIKCMVMENGNFPMTKLYGIGILKTSEYSKILIKDTFIGRIYNYDSIKPLYTINGSNDIFINKPENVEQYKENDIIYYIECTEDDEVKLYKGTIKIKKINHPIHIKYIYKIGYNKMKIDMSTIGKKQKTRSHITLKTDTKYGDICGQLKDIFGKHTNGENGLFKPSLLKTKKPQIIEKSAKLNKKSLKSVVELYLNSRKYLNDATSNKLQKVNNKYITDVSDILNYDLNEICDFYKNTSTKMVELYGENNIESSIEHLLKTNENRQMNTIENKFKRSEYIHDIYDVYQKNKIEINKYLKQNEYETSVLDNINDLNETHMIEWFKIINNAIKYVEIKLSSHDLMKIYKNNIKKFTKHFDKIGITVPYNLEELIEWDELDNETLNNWIIIFTEALKNIDIVNKNDDNVEIDNTMREIDDLINILDNLEIN